MIAFSLYYLISPLFIVEEVYEASPEETGGTTMVEALFQASAHDVSGKALLIEAEGKKVLRFEDFETINGPDLRIYLATDREATDIIDLGEIKATKGDVNYDIPEGTDIGKYRYVLVWCRAFSVLFSYAELPLQEG